MEAIYLEVVEMAETAHKAECRGSVSRMVKYLGVSCSGYHAWIKSVPSNIEKRYESVKVKLRIFTMNQSRIMVPQNHQGVV